MTHFRLKVPMPTGGTERFQLRPIASYIGFKLHASYMVQFGCESPFKPENPSQA